MKALIVLALVPSIAMAWQTGTIRPELNPWTMEYSHPMPPPDPFMPDFNLERMGNSWRYDMIDPETGDVRSGRIRGNMWGDYEIYED